MSRTNTSRRLRRNSTEVERLLWRRLRSRQLGGAKVRRQHPIGPFVVDFLCHARGLVFELDGGQHAAQAAPDGRRDRWLESEGYRVLRFWNREVMGNIDGVMRRILEVLDHADAEGS